MSTTTAPIDAAPTSAELQDLLNAPDLTTAERRELRRAIRFRRRVELWEARRAAPAPRKLHRAVITVAMMLGCLAMVLLLVKG